MKLPRIALVLLFASFAISTGPSAQDDATEKGLEQYRKKLKEDPFANPGNFDVDRGETLWTTPAGPKNVSLEKCDLGKGPGVVDGAFAELPRYFADANKVMDVEARVLWCMEKLQGFDRAALTNKPHPTAGRPVKDLGAIATFIASKSNGMKFAPKLDSPQAKNAVAHGETLFNRRSGPFDFSCSSCHSTSGQRIRLQSLPHLSDPKEARAVIGEWPGYRVSSSHVMTMQHRVYDCYWQMRMPEIDLASDAAVAIITYLTKQAEGGEISAPSIKR